jgi:hypothetical protein
MNRELPAPRRFAVMVPHRDIRPALRAWQDRLFTAARESGFALQPWAFPPAVPLARTDRPLTEAELKLTARSLRRPAPDSGFAAASGAGAAVSLTGWGGEAGDILLWGLSLDSPVPRLPENGVIPLPRLILCAFITGNRAADRERAGSIAAAVPAPALRFRAAAVANLVLTPLAPEKGGLSFAWELGTPRWLPRA